MDKINKLTRQIIGLAINVHKTLGSGFVERIYQRAMYLEFKNNKLKFEREKKIPVYYQKALLGYEKVDFIVNDQVILELKCVGEISEIHKAQLLSYLKVAKAPIGLIINFAKPIIEVKRLINIATPETQKNIKTQRNSVVPNNSASLRLQEKYSNTKQIPNKKMQPQKHRTNKETQKNNQL